MTKLKHLSTGIFAMALMLVFSAQAWAQSGTASHPASAVAAQSERTASGQVTTVSTQSSQQSKADADAALQNYKYDPSNPELSNARLSLLKAKAELANGQESKKLTKEQVYSLNKEIANLEVQVSKASHASKSNQPSNATVSKEISATKSKSKENSDPKSLSAAGKVQSSRSASNADPIIASKTCTRAQFLALTEVERKQLLPYIQGINVTDLVNATSADIKSPNAQYMTVSDFKSADPEKQSYILSNPSSFYMIIK